MVDIKIPHIEIVKANNGYCVFLPAKSQYQQTLEDMGMQNMMPHMEQMFKEMSDPKLIKARAEMHAKVSAEAFAKIETEDPLLESIRKSQQGESPTAIPSENPASDSDAQAKAQQQESLFKTATTCYVFPDAKSLLEFLNTLLLPSPK